MTRLITFFLFCFTLAAQNTAKYPAAVATTSDLGIAGNRTETTLTAGINSTSTTLYVQSGAQFKAGMYVTVDSEFMAICAASGNTLTVGKSSCPNVDGRGMDTANGGGSAASHLAGRAVQGRISAWHQNQAAAEIHAVEDALLNGIPHRVSVRTTSDTGGKPSIEIRMSENTGQVIAPIDHVGISSYVDSQQGRDRIWGGFDEISFSGGQDGIGWGREINIWNSVSGAPEREYPYAVSNAKNGLDIVTIGGGYPGTVGLGVVTSADGGLGWYHGIDISGAITDGIRLHWKSPGAMKVPGVVTRATIDTVGVHTVEVASASGVPTQGWDTTQSLIIGPGTSREEYIDPGWTLTDSTHITCDFKRGHPSSEEVRPAVYPKIGVSIGDPANVPALNTAGFFRQFKAGGNTLVLQRRSDQTPTGGFLSAIGVDGDVKAYMNTYGNWEFHPTNGNAVLSAWRETDVDPTGTFLAWKSAANTNLFAVDINGGVQAPRYGANVTGSASTGRFACLNNEACVNARKADGTGDISLVYADTSNRVNINSALQVANESGDAHLYNVSGITTASALSGQSKTVVVKGSDGNNCNLVFTVGLLTSTTCP